MTELAHYAHDIRGDGNPVVNKIDHFERALRPSYPSVADFATPAMGDSYDDPSRKAAVFSQALCRAFQHAALIFLYRSVCCLPTSHFLVQQHVHACLACITSMEIDSKAHNCTLFPLYVAGAHAIDEVRRKTVMERLEAVQQGLGFESVMSIRQALEQLWLGDNQLGVWSDSFKNLAQGTLVL
jgi:hypothetical protein